MRHCIFSLALLSTLLGPSLNLIYLQRDQSLWIPREVVMRLHSISSQTKYVVAALVTGLLVVSMANSAYAGKGTVAASGLNKGVSGSYNGTRQCATGGHGCGGWWGSGTGSKGAAAASGVNKGVSGSYNRSDVRDHRTK